MKQKLLLLSLILSGSCLLLFGQAVPRHSGGVIGTASFNPSSSNIALLVTDGVISNVTYTAAGEYAVVLTGQPDANYGLTLVVSSAIASRTATLKEVSKTSAGFSIYVWDDTGRALTDGAAQVIINVTRLSQ
jgi:hypothetical protein